NQESEVRSHELKPLCSMLFKTPSTATVISLDDCCHSNAKQTAISACDCAKWSVLGSGNNLVPLRPRLASAERTQNATKRQELRCRFHSCRFLKFKSIESRPAASGLDVSDPASGLDVSDQGSWARKEARCPSPRPVVLGRPASCRY